MTHIQVAPPTPENIERVYKHLGFEATPEIIETVIERIEDRDPRHTALSKGDSFLGDTPRHEPEHLAEYIEQQGHTRIVALNWNSLVIEGFHQDYITTMITQTNVDRIELVEEGVVITELPETGDRPGSELVGKAASGRPPLGFDVKNGVLQRSDNFDQVCRVLAECDGDRSIRSGAHELDCGRKTIRDILEDHDRRELYGLGPEFEIE